MKNKRAMHNLSRLNVTCFADILEKGNERSERDLEFTTSRPASLYSLVALAISKLRRNL